MPRSHPERAIVAINPAASTVPTEGKTVIPRPTKLNLTRVFHTFTATGIPSSINSVTHDGKVAVIVLSSFGLVNGHGRVKGPMGVKTLACYQV